MSYTIKNIENAIISALEPLTRERGGDVRTLDTYGGDVEQLLKGGGQLNVVPPAVLISFLGSGFNRAGAPMFERSIQFSVLHVSANLESAKNRREAAYGLMESTRAQLNNKDLGLSIAPLVLEREAFMGATGKMAVYSAEYRTSFEDLSQG